MKADQYRHLMTREYMMGPNTLRLLEEIMSGCTMKSGGRILDLGCGAGLSSLYIAQETGSTVFAVDLWCSATDNLRRFRQ